MCPLFRKSITCRDCNTKCTYHISLFSVSPKGSVLATHNNTADMPGSTLLLECSAEGGPGNEFRWLRNVTTAEDEDPDVQFLDEGEEYVIPDLSAEDGGEYVCFVNNTAGNDTDSIFVNGKQAPSIVCYFAPVAFKFQIVIHTVMFVFIISLFPSPTKIVDLSQTAWLQYKCCKYS